MFLIKLAFIINITFFRPNIRKFIELPFHEYKIDEQLFSSSIYLNDIHWIKNKINACGCNQLLNDISLALYHSEKFHLKFLKSFIEKYFKALNYDIKQFYSLLNEFFNADGTELSYCNSDVVQNWITAMASVDEIYLEKLNVGCDDGAKTDADPLHYDLVTNLPGKGCFVISLSTTREEICVWNAAR